jgi:Ca-activated chloride channel homolog
MMPRCAPRAWPVTGVLAALVASASMLTAQQLTFSTKLETVRVDVLVTENGKPVMGLKAADFEVLDNGVAQRVDLDVFEQLPVSVVLAFDTSRSVAGQRLADLRRAGNALLDGLKPGDRAALVSFGQLLTLACPITDDLDRLRTALKKLRADGDTSLVDATHAAMTLVESDTSRGFVIVFSDGLDTSSWLAAPLVLQTARRMNIVVNAVSVGVTGQDYLRQLTSVTGGSLFEIHSTSNLDAVLIDLLAEFRQRYVIGYTPHGVAAQGWHQVAVLVKGRQIRVQARPGYLVGPD